MQNQNIEGLENCASEVDNTKIDVLLCETNLNYIRGNFAPREWKSMC